MSSSSVIAGSPRFKAFNRIGGNEGVVLVNMDHVRLIEAIPSGLRLMFGNAASDRVDVRVTLDELCAMMTTL